MSSDRAEIIRLLAATERLAVTCHINPDGDAVGSVLALLLSARKAGKEAVGSFSDPFRLPETFSFLPVDELVPPGEFPTDWPVYVSFDAADLDRLGTLAGVVSTGKLVVVDHHVTNEGFGDYNLVVPEAAASAQLAFELITDLGWPIDEQIATCLMVGLVTDTGRFQYSNTSASALRAAAALVEAGAVPDLIGSQLFENSPFGFVHVAGVVQSRARLEPELSLVWAELRESDLEEVGLDPADTEGLIDYIRVAKEADVAVLLKQTGEGTKASLRSRHNANVGELAAHFGGGGHARAAGFEHSGSCDETIEMIREYLRGG
jgi:phosphoesterase RecJ-like protein